MSAAEGTGAGNLDEKMGHLSLTDKQVMTSVLLKNPQNGTIPCTTYGYHKIKTGGYLTSEEAPLKCTYALRHEMERHLHDMKIRGVVTEAAMECTALVILVARKSPEGTPKYTFCADTRDLNAITKVPVSSMPLVQENIDNYMRTAFHCAQHTR
jgi:hypothetical protein